MSENTGMYINIHEDFERVSNEADCFLRKSYKYQNHQNLEFD